MASRVYFLSVADFEAKLGPLDTIQAEQLKADPRKLISDFYQSGTARGPHGSLSAMGLEGTESLSDEIID